MKTTLVMLFCLSGCALAQTSTLIDPATRINWPLITGPGTPTIVGFPCGTGNIGQPFLDTATSPNTSYVCGSDGWGLTFGTQVFPGTPGIVYATSTSTSRPATSSDITALFNPQPQSLFFMSPSTGSGTPTFRSPVAGEGVIVSNGTANQTVNQAAGTTLNVTNLTATICPTGGYTACTALSANSPSATGSTEPIVTITPNFTSYGGAQQTTTVIQGGAQVGGQGSTGLSFLAAPGVSPSLNLDKFGTWQFSEVNGNVGGIDTTGNAASVVAPWWCWSTGDFCTGTVYTTVDDEGFARPGLWHFDAGAQTTVTPTVAADIANKAYVDAAVGGGGACPNCVQLASPSTQSVVQSGTNSALNVNALTFSTCPLNWGGTSEITCWFSNHEAGSSIPTTPFFKQQPMNENFGGVVLSASGAFTVESDYDGSGGGGALGAGTGGHAALGWTSNNVATMGDQMNGDAQTLLFYTQKANANADILDGYTANPAYNIYWSIDGAATGTPYRQRFFNGATFGSASQTTVSAAGVVNLGAGSTMSGAVICTAGSVGCSAITPSATINTAQSLTQADSLGSSTAKGMTSFGDSITNYTGCTSSPRCYVGLLATEYNVAANNLAVSSDTAENMTNRVFSSANPSDTGNPIVTTLIGTNNGFSTSAIASYSDSQAASDAWLALSSTNKVMAQSVLLSSTGTWTQDGTFASAPGLVCASSPCSLSLANGYVGKSGYFYVWYKTSSAGSYGNFGVTVDGASVSDTFSGGSSIPTDNPLCLGNTTVCVGVARFAATDGTHSISLTTSSGNVTVLGFGFPPSNRYRGSSSPRVYMGDVLPKQNGGNAAGVAALNVAASSIAKQLTGDGLNVVFVDVYGAVDPYLDMQGTSALVPISGTAVASNVLTVSLSSSYTFAVGTQVYLDNLSTSTFLDGQTVTVASSTATSFTATYAHASYTATETGFADTSAQNCAGSSNVGLHPNNCGHTHIAGAFESSIGAVAPVPATASLPLNAITSPTASANIDMSIYQLQLGCGTGNGGAPCLYMASNTGDASTGPLARLETIFDAGRSPLDIYTANCNQNFLSMSFDLTNGAARFPCGLETGAANAPIGSMATQNSGAVAITGGTIDGTVIGGTTPAAVTATTIATNEFSLRATSGPTLLSVGENAGASGYAGTQVTGAAVGGTGVNFIYGEWAGQYGIWNNAVGGAPLRLDLNAPGNSMYLQKDGSFTTPFATAPTGACPVSGSWAFSQDGHASFCSGGTWVVKI